MKHSLLIILMLVSGCGTIADVSDGLGVTGKINLGIAAWLLWGHDDSPKTGKCVMDCQPPMMARHSIASRELEQRDYN